MHRLNPVYLTPSFSGLSFYVTSYELRTFVVEKIKKGGGGKEKAYEQRLKEQRKIAKEDVWDNWTSSEQSN